MALAIAVSELSLRMRDLEFVLHRKTSSGIPSECGLHVAAAQRLRNSIELRKARQTQQKLDDDHIVEILSSFRRLFADIPAICST